MTDEIESEAENLGTETVEELEVTEEIIVDKPESAQESARAVYEELKAKADKEEGEKPAEDEAPSEEEKPKNELSEAARKLASGRKSKKRQTFVPEHDGAKPVAAPLEQKAEKLEPPHDWSVEDKEFFHTQPPEVQRNQLRWFKNAQGQTTKLWQDLNRAKSEAADVHTVAEKYYSQLNTNLSRAQVVEQLFQYQKKINEDSIGAIAEMIRHRGVSLEDIQARMNGQTQAPPRQAAPQPQQKYLTDEDFERKWQEREQLQHQSREVQSATDEVRSLQTEMQNGRYLWPELHAQSDIQRIQPLVSYFRETTPGITWAESYKRAILQDRANRGVGSPSPTSPRLTSEEIKSVRQASSSLRSRGGNGAIPRMSEPKANESHRESAEAAYWEVFGNKQH